VVQLQCEEIGKDKEIQGLDVSSERKRPCYHCSGLFVVFAFDPALEYRFSISQESQFQFAEPGDGPFLDIEPSFFEDMEHRGVLGEDLSREPQEALSFSEVSEVAQQF
jgi:hypothetical protein